jgi:hypothetical protein
MSYIIELVALVVLSYCRHLVVLCCKCNDNSSFFVHAFTGIVLRTMPRGRGFKECVRQRPNGGNEV